MYKLTHSTLKTTLKEGYDVIFIFQMMDVKAERVSHC